MYKLALAFVSLFFLIASPTAAAGAGQDKWIVTQLSGDARVVHPGAQPASLKVNNELSAGDTLLTGLTGRATLVRGGDYIVVAPRSELRLPSTPQPTGFTRVIQNLGTLLFKVQHTGIPHFAVDTPMLAAVVKGTTFTVVVDHDRSAVQVIQGAVQVTALDSGMSRIVEGGRTVFVNHTSPKVLQDADKPAPATTPPSSAMVTVSAAASDTPLATIASLTNGLVRADLSTPQPAPAPVITSTQAVTTSDHPSAPSESSTAPAVASTSTANPAGAVPSTTVSVGTTTTAPAPQPAVAVSTTTVAATVTAPAATVPTVTTPVVSTSVVTAPAVSTPTVTLDTNSGPGSANSGSGSLNSGLGSLSSGSGSGSSTPTVTVASVSTPTVTIPSVTTPIVPVTTPEVTVPSVSTPTVTVPAVSTPTVTVPSVTTPIVPVTTPTITVPSITLGGLQL